MRATVLSRDARPHVIAAMSACSGVARWVHPELLDHEAPEQRNSLNDGALDTVVAASHGEMLDQDATIRRSMHGAGSANRYNVVRRIGNRLGEDDQVVHRGVRGKVALCADRTD